jgi:hypothetical protein
MRCHFPLRCDIEAFKGVNGAGHPNMAKCVIQELGGLERIIDWPTNWLFGCRFIVEVE